MNFIKPDEIQWREVRYLKVPLEGDDDSSAWKYRMWLNEPLASWDVFSYWEKERVASMEKHLKHGDVLFDVGTEQGWCNLVYAQIVGPENMVLIEPTKEFWPNIKTLWEKNFDKPPLGTFSGFLSNDWTQSSVYLGSFPDEAEGDLIDRNKYQYLHESEYPVDRLRLDMLDDYFGNICTSVTIDTEGSELLILQGATRTLERGVKLWVSIHDDLAERDYNVKPGEVVQFMESLGYVGEHLATDHEAHWYFERQA